MKKFFDSGRKRELLSLEKLYARDEFAFAVVYGRRRVGKTSLIDEFIMRGEKKAIRFIATENTDTVNLLSFSQAVFAVYPESSAFGSFPDWESAFVYIAKHSNGEKVIVEIDEYPYLAKARPAISSMLQKSIDRVFQDTKLMLILCGSSMSFMEYQVLGYQSPLYGRRTAQYRIMPLDYYDSAEFFGDADLKDKLLGYAVTGGIPQYLKVIARAESVEVGIDEAFFTKDGYLYEEPQNLLKQELREPALYNAIIAAIATGATKLNDIATKVREDDSKIAKYIKNLTDLGIIEKETPIFSEGGRNGVYCIKDNMYRFWYRFVPNAVTLIENGNEYIYEKKVKPFLSDYMGRVFETVCKQYLLRLNAEEKLPFLFEKIGRWWGGNPITKKETEIDLIAADKNNMIICECKWQNEELGLKVYKDLKEKTAMFADKEIYYYLFSKSGFSSGLKEEAKKNDGLTLVTVEDLFCV
ncbi:MAG: ATP-binding protein [Clostridiales bacterium]|jgi:AAA+ ATPase superfamily predicted ATPase|nr:ATP-binding protein [Clostridiales bacterium]